MKVIIYFFLASAITCICEGSGQSGNDETKCKPSIAENMTENVLCIEFGNLTCLKDTFNLEENIISCLPEAPKFCIDKMCSTPIIMESSLSDSMLLTPSLTSSITTTITSTTYISDSDVTSIGTTIASGSDTCITSSNAFILPSNPSCNDITVTAIVGWSMSGILLVSCTVLNLILLCRLVTVKKQYQTLLHNTNTENNYEMTSTEYTMVQQRNNPSTDNNNTIQVYSIPLSSKNETFERQIIETSGLEEEVVDSAKEESAQADNTLYATVNKPIQPQSTLHDYPTPPTYATVNKKAPPPLPDRISDDTQTIPTYAVVNKQAPPIPISMYDCVKLEHQ